MVGQSSSLVDKKMEERGGGGGQVLIRGELRVEYDIE
jgi:hypothetical protein